MKATLLTKLMVIVMSASLVSCSSQPAAATVPLSHVPSTTSTPTSSPTSTSTPDPTPTSTPTPVPLTRICSPLNGIGLEELHSITSNTFRFTSAFTDDGSGHPGVDLAFFTHGSYTTMYGLPVQSILPGKVTQVIDNRFPYGNMIIIETQLTDLSPDLLAAISIPTPIPQQSIETWSTCDKEMTPISWSESARSIYVLYAHLESKPDFEPGDLVECGQVIGAVGITGNSVAEHLHMEVRIGPSDARFGSMAYFKEDQLPEERYNYCIWSLSGRFQAIDPALFWKGQD